ncbi:hypothetical protein EG829_28775, partial [bacterium]|nr:hypothetical protein [bacterium]
EDKWTVSEKIQLLLTTVGERRKLKFSELFEAAAGVPEVVVTFLALLELIRLKQLVAVQAEPFSEIEIHCAETSAEPTQTAADADLEDSRGAGSSSLTA